jgi:membrane protein
MKEKGRRSLSRMRLLARPSSAVLLLKATFSECITDNVQRMSAALAYYTIFSLAPLLVIAIAIAGLVFGEKAAQGEMVGEIQELIGRDGAKAVQTMIQSAYSPPHSLIAGAIGIITLLFGATSAFSEVYDALNNIWNVDGDKKPSTGMNILKARFLSFGMILIIGFLLMVSLVVSAMLTGIGKYAATGLAVPAPVLHSIDFVFSFIVVTVLFGMIFKTLPEAKIAWSDVWMGAALTALLFTTGKFIIGFYIGKSVSESSYGAASSLVIVVAWIYYSALILYFGAEFTHVYAREFGSQFSESKG